MTRERRDRSSCIDPATLAAFVDRTIQGSARTLVESHLATCADCREVWRNTVEAREALESAPKRGSARSPHRRLRWILPLSAAAGFVVALLWFARAPHPSVTRPELLDLVAAAGSYRPGEGRLSGGFPWAPVRPATRGGEPSGDASPEIRIAAARLDQQLERGRTPRSLAAHGTGRLFLDDPDAAVNALEEATALDPANAEFWSDLSTAYLARHSKNGDDSDVPKALEAADQALDVAPLLPEALFNRAVALERLGLKQEAIDAWKRYLTVDNSTPWSREARERLSALEAGSRSERAKPRSQQLRDRLLDTVLAEWGASVTTDPAKAGDRVEQAQEIAATLARLSPSDTFAADVLAAISRAGERSRQVLARAHADFGRARQLYRAGQLADAAKHFSAAEHTARRAASPLAILADLYASIVHYRRSEFEHSLTRLNAALDAAAGRRYPSVTGRIHWMFGNVAMFQGRHGEAVASYTRALEDFVAADETGYEANAWSLLANLHGQLGARKQAWMEWRRALALIDAEPDSAPKQGLLLAAAEDALTAGWEATASHLQESALGVAVRTGNTAAIVDTHLRRAVLQARAGRPHAATQAIDEARHRLSALPDETTSSLRAELDLAEARTVLPSDPLRAASAASRAVEYYSAADGTFRLPSAYAVLAAAQRRAGQHESAVRSLERGLAAAERQRRSLSPDLQRVYADSVRALGDEHIAVLAEQGRTTEAFEALERMKNRLLRQAALQNVAPTTATELARRLPDDVVFAAFSVHESQLLRWTFKRGQLRFASIPLPRRKLEQLIESLDHTGPPGGARDSLTTVLLGGVVGPEDREKPLVLMLDGPLHMISFAALRGLTHEYLVEEHPITITPSAAFLIHGGNEPAPRLRTSLSILAVGNPPVDRRAFPGLTALPEAAAEVQDIERLYGRSTALVSKDATPDAILARLASVDVFHFAGHAVINAASPAKSLLVVSDSRRSGIAAHEIEGADLRHARLVVLSACEAAAGPLSASEGPMNLVRPFLAAGVPVVVASLWKVEDRASRQVMVDFHRRYTESGDAASALRAAQMEVLRRGRTGTNNRTWSAFSVFGALARS